MRRRGSRESEELEGLFGAFEGSRLLTLTLEHIHVRVPELDDGFRIVDRCQHFEASDMQGVVNDETGFCGSLPEHVRDSR